MRPPFHSLPASSLRRLTILSERPPICTARGLLSEDECARLIAKASQGPPLQPQTFDTAGGERTSTGCVLRNEEIPTLRERFASLVGVSLEQLQPLKVSRYLPGERFDVHTDAIRGDLRDAPADADDWWADGMRASHGVPGAPVSGCNRMATIFVYLNSVARGGRTRWRWTEHDLSFYEAPRPGHGRIDVGGAGAEIAVTPEEGLGVVHFPALSPDRGGLTDYNAYHEAEPPEEGCVKWVAQQFIWSHSRLDWKRVLDEENHEPSTRRSADTI